MNSQKRRKHRSKGRSKSKTTNEEVPEIGDTFEVKTSTVMGRYLVSCKNLRPGDLILEEEPLVVGPCAGSKLQCLGCYKPLENIKEITKCKCNWPLCHSNCPGVGTRHGHHQLECDTLKRISINYDLDELSVIFNAIVPLRCLLLKQIDPEGYESLIMMEAHNKIRENIPDLWKNNQTLIVDRIRNDWGLTEYTPEEIHNICGILEVNSFEIGQGISIRGLYPTAFLLSHDCVPNTNHTDQEATYKLSIRASTSIQKGQPITLSYAYTLQNTLKRREHLLENKFFECACKRCSDPTELATYTGALICPKCGVGNVLSSNPLDQEAHWMCTKCQNYGLGAATTNLLLERIAQEADSVGCNDVVGMETFLSKYRNVLHPNHYLNLGVKLSLSQVYGKISGYLIHELCDEQLIRKKELCEEILKVFDVIEPGYTRLRGVTLYEMHAPLMILLNRQFARKEVSKGELRNRLRRVVECLEEAELILADESKSSNEGIMGVAATDALLKIREWEKILGKI